MTIFALQSAGGSPGVTTSAIALALGWPSRVIVAECDPSGGDILAGLLGGHVPPGGGLLTLALEAGRAGDLAVSAFWRHLIELDAEGSRLLLAGLSDPRQSIALQPSWPGLAATFAAVPCDVIADCGRLDASGAVPPLLAAAGLVALVLRPTLRQVSRARPRIDMLTEMVSRERIAVLLAGDGPHSRAEVAGALGVPVLAALPRDAKAAALLADGLGSRRALRARPLMRSAAGAGRALREAAALAGRPSVAGQQEAGYPAEIAAVDAGDRS
ncbi:MAG: hypothetical protein ACLPN6_27460 [Streptosporangiaceae bacterium]|jgi:hypothetical protein